MKELKEFIAGGVPARFKGAENLANYFIEQYRYSIIPDDKTLLIEIIPKADIVEYIFHSLIGRKANDALSRAFAYLISKRKKTNVKVIVTDYGFALIVPKEKALSKAEILSLFQITNLREVLEKALDNTEMLKRIFRQVATTGLMILRRYAGKKKSVNRQQLDAGKLLKFLKKNYPDFPLLKETYRTILEDKMDIENAEYYLSLIQGGKIKVIIEENELPPPFAWNIEALGSSDIVLMEDKKELIKTLHKELMKKLSKNS